ncbi:MAG: hypothetical protein DMF92_00595 [Acidobacteria bacterium]|nr:MAG: hypothetical protein DMF92_00595 [Acidobacteriota bacterium]
MSISPLFDFFKRGEVDRDVRLLAAQGGLAPRAHEQLSILMLLLDDGDTEIRQTAEATLSRIPNPVLSAFLARSDVPDATREFFAGRGVFPAETATAAEETEEPLIEAGATDDALSAEEEEGEDRESLMQRLSKMTFPDRLKAASKGSREMRAILIRDPNKMIAAAVMSSPKLTDAEVEGIAKMASVSEDVLRIIGANRNWMKKYKIFAALTRNPKTPVALTLNILSRLNAKDMSTLAVDRNVPEAVRVAARKKIVANRD